ncbi:exopolysaccharide biosynthesis polyprenyl glycosylphosphotransferase [Flavobacterium sp.]|uniref:exopolysaccharide biosynthesis polyprenyl glycosylphosphotransferase n=1 Tax=Flavobacterium sp. TaxID=239 RepID=UPI0025C0FD41|nr:exopolysaccharide biosynthesis polyprenyl glycosylphosphotransferase [Flavobacterium sp.]MBA4154169.1 sugar transferase [Flavobacterium sp.]
MQSKKKIHFEVSERKILLRLFDVLFVLLSLYIVGIVFQFDYFSITTYNFYWIIVLGAYILIIGSVFEMYNLQVASNQFQVIKSIILTSSTTVLVFLLTPFFTPTLPSNRLQILYFYIAIFIALFLWRMFYLKYLASHRFEKKVILICEKELADELILGLKSVDPHYTIVALVNTDENSDFSILNKTVSIISVAGLEKFVSKNSISEIVIATQKTEEITVDLYNKLLLLLENGFIIREYTHVYENLTQRIPVQYVARDFYRYFPFSRSNQNQLYLLFVRIFEYIIAIIGITLGLFFVPFILIGNFIGNRGKLFYSQIRVGKNGEEFRIIKFRTMVKNAESAGAVFATTNDARITPFGKFLRKSRIDEFPQFINILLGHMAVIGPRPERPVFVNEIAEIMPFYQTRHVVKPGLTGWAQVNYSYGDSIDDSLIKLQYDLYYIKHRSIFLDFNIMLKTLSTILFFRGQ